MNGKADLLRPRTGLIYVERRYADRQGGPASSWAEGRSNYGKGGDGWSSDGRNSDGWSGQSSGVSARPLLNDACKIFAGSMPGDVTREEIRAGFGVYGTVVDMHIMAGKSKSGHACAFITLASPAEVEACVAGMKGGYALRRGAGPIEVRRYTDYHGRPHPHGGPASSRADPAARPPPPPANGKGGAFANGEAFFANDPAARPPPPPAPTKGTHAPTPAPNAAPPTAVTSRRFDGTVVVLGEDGNPHAVDVRSATDAAAVVKPTKRLRPSDFSG